MDLNKTTWDKIAPAINATWSYLEADTAALYAEPGNGRLTNKAAMEVTIDAGRLLAHGGHTGGEADQIVCELIKKHGYKETFNWLVKQVNLLS